MLESTDSPALAVPATAEEKLIEATIASSIGGSEQTGTVPAYRSHDPQSNKFHSDPFQFGNRVLTEEDDVFEFNAWDHVETDDAFKEFAEQQYDLQRQSPVSDFDKSKWTPSPPLANPRSPAGLVPGVVMMIKNA